MIDRQLGPAAEARFYRSIAAGELRVEALTDTDCVRVAELVDHYAELGLGGVDASIVAVAERLHVKDIATLDRRDFTSYVPATSRRSNCSHDQADTGCDAGESVVTAMPRSRSSAPSRKDASRR